MSRILIIIGLLTVSIIGKAQFIGSTNWVTETDYRLAEDTIIENILWLEENPLATDFNDTKAISQYVLDWLTGTPYLSVTLDEIFTGKIVKNRKYKYGDKFVVTYLFGKSIYTIQNPDEPNELNATVRGVIGMVKVYKELLKSDLKAYNRTLEIYKDLYEDGTLEDYIRDELESRGIGS